MPVFKDLSLDKKYLINEFDGDQVLLVEPIMKTESCVLILIHEDVETFQWKKLNDEVLDFFKKENFEIKANSYFNIESDIDIGKVDPNYLYEVLSNMNLNGAEALFVSCTALPALSIINKLEEKLNKFVLSSNQTLIWDSLNAIGYKNNVEGFGKLFNS